LRDNYRRFACLSIIRDPVSEVADDAEIARKRRATALTTTQCGYASTYYQYLQRVRSEPAALHALCRCELQQIR